MKERCPAGPRLATRLTFLAAGFGMASWAPLVPFAKVRLGVDDSTLGLLLLCAGLGSVAIMPATGAFSGRRGGRPVIVAAGLGVAAALPCLEIARSLPLMALLLALFGASLGGLNVAMNVHAVEVERAEGRPLMSGFHAQFSVGAFLGAGLMTLLLSHGAGARGSVLLCALLVAGAIVAAAPFLLAGGSRQAGPLLAWPKGIVLLLAAIGAISFLVEGAMRDWSALLIVGQGLVPASRGGLGYSVFSIAMTVGRLVGDAMVVRVGDRAVLLGGCGAVVLGLLGFAAAPTMAVALAACLAMGLGAANIVPVLYRRAGSAAVMPAALAVAALTTIGHGAIIVGPAVIGLVSDALGLPASFVLLAALMCLVPALAGSRRVWNAGAG